MRMPKYFISVSGDPKPPNKDTIESGVYHPDPKYAPFTPEPGDILLLYCTNSYDDHAMRIPGIGIVLLKNNSEIHYRYLPLSKSISKSEINQGFEPADKKKFDNIRFSSHWLFEISKISFIRTFSDRYIVWP